MFDIIQGVASPSDISLIERAFPPGCGVPMLDVPRFWSNRKLDDPDTIIALVLDKPTTEDLARTIVSYGPRRVIATLERLSRTGDLSAPRVERARSWLVPIIKGVADAARELTAS
ncbi:hypothetical protein KRR38_31550 [Novosphingobium sp. G106]|uniref:hypothetical protein n=1 Tax=Novosphingobium sp. G106 TaxID=2849500 RepID=UPI001C2D3A6D|nr:hypothetical protein [Novosphingobium sp. G106]MBV1692085.1 hypothetical protein [Novosphingobium sp. G106]